MEEVEDVATAAANKKYLRQLTHLVHLRVLNLGETVIPMSKYGVSLCHLGKRGLNFDIGEKAPLGKRDKPHLKEPYELIQPVSGMMDYLKNTGDKIEHMDKLLPFLLESTCYIHGDAGLYAAEKIAFLFEGQTAEGLPVCKARTLKKLLEGVVEMDYSNPGVAKPQSRQGDLAAFKPQLGLEAAGRLYDVKQEIYRLPDRLLYRLAMYYGILSESGWDAVEQLASKGIIGVGVGAQEAAHHLQYIVSFATMLLLRAYLLMISKKLS